MIKWFPYTICTGVRPVRKSGFLLSISLLLWLTTISLFTKAQSFQDVSDILPFEVYTSGTYGNGVSVVDMNGDLLDDILVSTKQIPPYILINNGNGFDAAPHNIQNDGDIKMISAADYDNDGDRDIFITRYFGVNSLWRNDGDWNFTDVTVEAGLEVSEGEFFGHSWCDVNRDGILDLYVCNYSQFILEETNLLYLGGADGVFTNNTASTPAADGFNYSLQNVFFDSDLDGWEDLFVANDRTISDNHLYQNTNGAFTDISASAQIDTNIFSMSASPEDFDHDGDFDLYVSNNPTGNLLYRNLGNNVFEEVADEVNAAIDDMSWSAVWIDVDNDGWRDLFVAIQSFWNQPGQNRIIKNQEGEFIDWTAAGGIWGQTGESYGAATGDFNNDGHEDLVVECQSPNSLKVLQNYGLEGEWIKVALTGTVSNRDAIGSLISVYAEGVHYLREIRSGENYLGQNSLTKTFGLGENCEVDSMVIKWPSGYEDRFYGLSCGNTYQIIEGNSLMASLTTSGEITLCPGDSLWLSTNSIFASYSWSSGSDSASILITAPGTYSTQVQNELGFTASSDTLIVQYSEFPLADLESSDPLCHGDLNGSIIVTDTLSQLAQIWISGDSTSVLEDLPAGSYDLEMLDQTGCWWYQQIDLVEPEQLEVAYTVEGINDDGTGYCQLDISGGTPPYDVSWSNGASGSMVEFDEIGNYTVSVEDVNGCGWYSGFNITSVGDLTLETGVVFPNPVHHSLNFIDFNENLKSITIYTSLGSMVERWSFSGVNSATLDLSNLPSGLYKVQIKLESGAIQFHSVIKE